jgi:hypothetical protein
MRSRRELALAVLVLCTAAAGAIRASELRVRIGPVGGGMTIREEVKSVQEARQEGVTHQQLDYSCGSAALATLFNSYLHQPVEEREIIDYILKKGDLRKIMQRRAFSLLDLKRFAESRGVEAQGYRLEYQDLVELGRPALVPIVLRGYKHFVIFRGETDGRVYLADPAFGRWTASRAEFEQLWEPKVGLTVWRKGQPAPTAYALRPGEEDNIYVAPARASALSLRSRPGFVHSPLEF